MIFVSDFASLCSFFGFSFLSAVGVDAFGDRVTVCAERSRGMSDAFLVAGERFLNIELLELLECFIKQYVAVEHVFNDSFQAGAYLHRSTVLT